MAKTKSKSALLASGLSLVLCFAMLLGTTFAWFSDSVSNKGNKITAGSLKIGFYSADEEELTLPAIGATTAENPTIGKWTDLKFSKTAVFTMGTNKAPAQPGDKLTKYIAIRNEGNIALQYYLDFLVNDGGLGDAVTFAFKEIHPNTNNAKTVTGSQLANEQINGSSATKNDHVIYQMDLTFLESAGNTYQGGTFELDLNLTATQDKDGARAALIKAKDASDFKAVPANATIVLQKNITLTEDVTLGYCNIDLNGYTLDLANHSLKIENLTEIGTADIEGGTVKNGTITVNVPNGTINAYDKYTSAKFDIQAVAPHSFHFFGSSSGDISISKGLLVIEPGASIKNVIVPDTAQEVSIENKGSLTNVSSSSTRPVNIVVSDGGNTPEITGDTVDVVNNNFDVGKGTAESPFEITNATQLSYVGKDLKASYILMNDIDLKGVNFTKIGTAYRLSSSVNGDCFSGVFDGNGKTISNMTIKGSSGVGLFSGIKGENAVVKNLNIVSANVSGGSQTGAIAGLMTGGAIIQNCTVDSKTTVTSSKDVGGIVGQGVGSNTTDATPKFYAKVDNCTNNATVTSTAGAGAGIVGKYNYVASGTTGEIEVNNCTNNGSINALYAGGISGYTVGATINDCINNGKITGTGAQPSGGIASGLFQSSVKNCQNSGTVTNNTNPAGGIAGYAQDVDKASVVLNCTNSGKISGTEAGGIVGTFGIAIDGCTNVGEVTGTVYAGGIMGMSNSHTISNSVNKGKINGKDYVGGIAGNCSYNILTDCINEGTVVGTGDYVGGIAGISVNKGAKIMNCTNKATVKGASMVGGVIGQLNGTIAEFNNNTNQGSVEGTDDVGGVIGKYATGVPVTPNANALVNNCENNGSVKGNKNVGGFMGSTQLRTAGGNTIFTNCKTTSSTVTGTTNVGAFVGLTVEKDSVLGTQDHIFASCTYTAIGNLTAIGFGPGGANITLAD